MKHKLTQEVNPFLEEKEGQDRQKIDKVSGGRREREREMEEEQEKEATGYVSQTRDITGSFNRQLEDRL